VQEDAGHHPDGGSATQPDSSVLIANLRSLVTETSEQGLNVALRIADYVGPQPAKGIANIAREAGAQT
jgi:hypothetical protein